MSAENRRIAAIMFTDIVGYSSMTQENEALALELVDEHFKLLRPIIPKFSGNEIKTMGDGFLIEFSSPLNAVNCAIEFQKSLHIRNLDETAARKILIRIGIHLGDIEYRNGDVLGDGVNIASRIEPLAEPGGIALTRQVYDQVYNKIDWELKSLGTPQLKNITTVVEIFRVELNWDAALFHTRRKIAHQRLDQRLKIASVIAAGVIAVVAAFFLVQSIFAPGSTHFEPGEITSLAVLPFENLSSDSQSAHLGSGIAEELVHAMNQIEELTIHVGNSEYLKGRSIKEIGDLLHVQAIIQGSVRRTDNRIRISVQLIQAFDESYLWSEQYDHEFEDIIRIQELIAQAVIRRLGYIPEEELGHPGTNSIQAYNLYLQGRFEWSKRTESGLANAIEFLRQAIELDPDFVNAYVGLADAYLVSANYGYLAREEGYPQAEELSHSALEIDKDNAEAYATLGWISYVAYENWEESARLLQNSIDMNPNYATAHQRYKILLRDMGREDDALIHAQRASELDPLSPVILINYAQELHFHRRYDEAIEVVEKILKFSPEFEHAYRELARIYQEQGRWQEAEDTLMIAIEKLPESGWLHEELARHYMQLGEFRLAEFEVQHAINLLPDSIIIRRLQGFMYLMARRYEDAISYIEETILMDEAFARNWLDLAWAHYYNSEISKAFDDLDAGLQLVDPLHEDLKLEFQGAMGAFHAKDGNRAAAEGIINELKSEYSDNNADTSFDIATVYAALSDSESTLEWLDKVVENRDDGWGNINIYPLFDPFRNEPEFQSLLARMGFVDQ